MKKIVSIIIILFCIGSIIRSGQEIFTLLQKRTIVLQSQHKLESLQQKQKQLNQQMQQSQDPAFIQETARNKLFLNLPDETRVLVSTDAGVPIIPQKRGVLPYWQEWLQSVSLCCGATIENGL